MQNKNISALGGSEITSFLISDFEEPTLLCHRAEDLFVQYKDNLAIQYLLRHIRASLVLFL